MQTSENLLPDYPKTAILSTLLNFEGNMPLFRLPVSINRNILIQNTTNLTKG